ncbi:MAG TPA: lysophospholipid acyltransferase family protein [Rhizomicrobium sp.]|nr:lysophospholipid acyltransferase family protein [Rhizomicrobium sp.]
MQSLRAAYALGTFLLSAVFVIPYQAFALRFKTLGYKNIPQRYQRFLTRVFGIRVTVIGKPVQDRGVLMVSNHSSYLDILALGGVARVSFVAKSEVASWPLFGTFARLQRTVFVERERRSKTGESRDQLRERLVEGDALVLFPEGTSNDGNRVLPFKSALMGAAETQVGIDADGKPIHVPVQPVSITYVGVHGIPMGREFRPFFAWYGDMELVDHLWEGLVTGPVDVVIEFHPPLTVDEAGGRKRLAPLVEQTVRRGQACALAGLAGKQAIPKASAVAPTPEPARAA